MTIYEKTLLSAWFVLILLFFAYAFVSMISDFERPLEIIAAILIALWGAWVLAAIPVVISKIWIA